MPGVLPNFICSHVPMEIFLFYKTGKKPGNQKKSCLHKGRNGRFLYSCILLRFQNTLGIMSSGAPPSRERTHMTTSPATKRMGGILHLQVGISPLRSFLFSRRFI
jgi:hypothetical protein